MLLKFFFRKRIVPRQRLLLTNPANVSLISSAFAAGQNGLLDFVGRVQQQCLRGNLVVINVFENIRLRFRYADRKP